jgi:hypothetical protein
MSKTYKQVIRLLESDPDIEVSSRGVSRNSATGDEYDRVIYHNKREDLWFNIEKPRES